MTKPRLAAFVVALALTGCAVVHQGPSLNDSQTVMTLLKFTNNGLPTDLTVTGQFDRSDGNYKPGDPIVFTIITNKPAWVAVLRVVHSGDTTIIFPNRTQPDAHAANGIVHVTVPAGPEGTEFFEFIAATDGTTWIFTKKSTGSSDYADLGGTTRATVTDLQTTFRHAERGTIAVSHTVIKVGN